MKRIVVRKPGTARLAGTSSVIHKGSTTAAQ
ncbi:hypothetical protein SAMN05421874_1342 [Nonomuraea maritima]|uniref:Uncharacterized protein n=1 Tax=Nonomuraea maritima TaxID=683260 RepID=A0A1G9PDS8_9ACTN|nr:hypothetical protein SAMN05421874_1342 [Nonomuraea maritima]